MEYSIQVLDWIEEDELYFIVKLNDPGSREKEQIIKFKQSSLREIHEKLENVNYDLPPFPARNFFTSIFQSQRSIYDNTKEELQEYFTRLIAIRQKVLKWGIFTEFLQRVENEERRVQNFRNRQQVLRRYRKVQRLPGTKHVYLVERTSLSGLPQTLKKSTFILKKSSVLLNDQKIESKVIDDLVEISTKAAKCFLEELNYFARVYSISRIRGKKRERIWTVMDYYPTTLQTVIKEQISQQRIQPFLRSQIFQLIQLSIRAMATLTSYPHNNIKPSNIYFNPDESNFQFLDAFETTHRLKELSLITNSDAKTPERVKQYQKQGEATFLHQERHISDVFSMGVCMIQACNLLETEDLKQLHNSEFTKTLFDSNLSIIQKNYGESVANVIQMMVAIKPKERSTPDQIFSIVFEPDNFKLEFDFKADMPLLSDSFDEDIIVIN